MSDWVNGGEMSPAGGLLPMFPLNAVLVPGAQLPLRVFEERYRALIHHLLRIPDPADRVFGTVAIREGYEVGEHGTQSLYRIGVRLQLTQATAHPDGSFDVVALGRDRIAIDKLDTSGAFPAAHVRPHPEPPVALPDHVNLTVRSLFTAYRAAVSTLRSDPYEGTLPSDPEFLSWTLSAVVPLPMAERQSLLEADDADVRLTLLIDYLRAELEAMNVIPSLPATEVARTAWSPN